MLDRIEVNPNVCHGKTVIRGTRIMIRNILGSLAGGDSIQVILLNYPEITYADIEAVIAYAIELVNAESNPSRRIAGLQRGKVWMSDDFDAPLEFGPSEK